MTTDRWTSPTRQVGPLNFQLDSPREAAQYDRVDREVGALLAATERRRPGAAVRVGGAEAGPKRRKESAAEDTSEKKFEQLVRNYKQKLSGGGASIREWM